MRHSARLGPVFVTLVVLLAGCFGSNASPSADPPTDGASQPPASASASAGSAPPASQAPASDGGSPAASAPTPEPIPSEELPPLACEFPIVENASVAIANITDVRVGTHEGYDRVVFEFEQGTPELTLDRATPPFTQDASGEPIDVEGTSFLRLTMRGGTKQTDAGTSSYDGPRDLHPEGSSLVHLIEGGDFERQSTWYLGLTAETCARVLLLEDPPRVVIDVEHP